VKPDAPTVAHARIALEPIPDLWLDVTVESSNALAECEGVVNRELTRMHLAPKDVVRACDDDALPQLAAYHLVTTLKRGLLWTPNSLYTLETVVPVESVSACEARKTELEFQDEIAFVETGNAMQRDMDKKIAETKRVCAEARGFDPACSCEVVGHVVTFKPATRECRASR
jgi:hypothetical protein